MHLRLVTSIAMCGVVASMVGCGMMESTMMGKAEEKSLY